jgi:CHAT domain-containing protein
MYERLADGDPPARALRTAQLETAASHAHPFFWAPFVYVAGPGLDLDGGERR